MIRDTIIEAAARQKLDYKALAEMTGLPRATVHRYLKGVRDMTGDRLDMLMSALGIETAVGPMPALPRVKRQAVEVKDAASYVELLLCDFRELSISPRSIDLIATDVPWTLKATSDWVDFAQMAKTWLHPDGLCAVMIGTGALGKLIAAIEAGGLKYQWVFPIHFKTPTADRNGIFSLWRPMVIFGKSKMHRFNGKRDRLLSDGAEKDYHEYQQPVRPFRELIVRLTSPGDLVLDCFMGTGTTGVACMTAEGGRRNFIGCDRDPHMFAIAKKRPGLSEEM